MVYGHIQFGLFYVTDRKNQKQSTDNLEHKADETETASDSDAVKDGQDAENGNGLVKLNKNRKKRKKNYIFSKCHAETEYIFFVLFLRTTNQVLNLAKSMCHEILKEEDDEVESLDDVATKDQLDELLDEQNGNITAKLTNLTLNDNENTNENTDAVANVNVDEAAGVNGNGAANASDRIGNTKNKKKTKKGTNSINTNKLSTGTECDSNENKFDADSNANASEASDDRLAVSGKKDDVVNVNA